MSEHISIPAFFKNKTILIAGSREPVTFLIIKQILSATPDILNLYLLTHSKNKSVTHNGACPLEKSDLLGDLKNHIKGESLERLFSKVSVIEGNFTLKNADIKGETYQSLSQSVDIMINTGTNQSFNEPIDRAIIFNIYGVKRLLELAKKGKRKTLLYISTTYVNHTSGKNIKEKLLDAHTRPSPHQNFDLEETIKHAQELARTIKEKSRMTNANHAYLTQSLQSAPDKKNIKEKLQCQLDMEENWRQKELIQKSVEYAKAHGWKDICSLTKSIGEQLIMHDHGKTQIVILRPSIVTSALQETKKANLFESPHPLISDFIKKYLPAFFSDTHAIVDFIPADFVANAVLISLPTAKTQGFPIYHITTGSTHPLMMKKFAQSIANYLQKTDGSSSLSSSFSPFLQTIRCQKFLLSTKFQNFFSSLLYFFTLGKISLKKISIKEDLQRLISYENAYTAHIHSKTSYSIEKILSLKNCISEEDQQRYPIDPENIRWDQYLEEVIVPQLFQKFTQKNKTSSV